MFVDIDEWEGTVVFVYVVVPSLLGLPLKPFENLFVFYSFLSVEL